MFSKCPILICSWHCGHQNGEGRLLMLAPQTNNLTWPMDLVRWGPHTSQLHKTSGFYCYLRPPLCHTLYPKVNHREHSPGQQFWGIHWISFSSHSCCLVDYPSLAEWTEPDRTEPLQRPDRGDVITDTIRKPSAKPRVQDTRQNKHPVSQKKSMAWIKKKKEQAWYIKRLGKRLPNAIKVEFWCKQTHY